MLTAISFVVVGCVGLQLPSNVVHCVNTQIYKVNGKVPDNLLNASGAMWL